MVWIYVNQSIKSIEKWILTTDLPTLRLNYQLMALHVETENSSSYILRNGKLSFRKSKNINGMPRKFRISWWSVLVPEATLQPLRLWNKITFTKALSQKRCFFKIYKFKRNELTENPKTLLESSSRFAVFEVLFTFRRSQRGLYRWSQKISTTIFFVICLLNMH